MTSVKSAQLQLQSEPTQIQQKDQPQSKIDKSDDQSQNASQEEENQRIVDILFPKKNLKSSQRNQQISDEEDSDIKAFLEEQVPGLYRASTNDEIYEESSQEESPEISPSNNTDFYMNYSLSQGPCYFTMSKFQKLSYFQSLNSIYMNRMRCDKQKKNAKQHFNKVNSQGKQQELNDKKDKNKKRAIRFNQIVCELPFNKDQEPIAVKDSPEEEAFIVFDDEAYDGDFEDEQEEEEEMAREFFEMKKIQEMERTSVYIDEQEDSDSPETLYNMERMQFLKELNEIQKYNGQQQNDEDQDHVFFTDSQDELLDYDEQNDEWPSQDSNQFEEQFKQNFSREENKTLQQCRAAVASQKQRKSWKRDHQRQFLEDDHSSSDQSSQSQSSGDSSEVNESNEQGTPKKVKTLKQAEKQNEKEILQEAQFLQGINGRKINPNLSTQQQTIQEKSTLQANGLDVVNESLTNENDNSQSPEPIITENNQVLQTQHKSQQQVCQNTCEGKPIE